MEFVLTNKNGMRITADSKGCVLKEIFFDGQNMICTPPYAAAVIGRIAGRISHAKFVLSGKTYELPKNENDNQLHGNHEFDRNADWQGEVKDNQIIFTYTSPKDINGFPGTVDVKVTYTLSDDNELRIDYFATTDEETLLNLTNHAYFNLNKTENEIANHILTANTKYFVPLKDDLTPTGELALVDGTTFDIRAGRKILDAIESEDSQNVIAKNGFDHAFVFADCENFDLYTNDKVHSATLECPESNRKVVMRTSYPCFVCYTGNQMKERPHMGVCLEAQLLPDAINNEGFGSIILEPEKPFSHFVSYKFEVV